MLKNEPQAAYIIGGAVLLGAAVLFFGRRSETAPAGPKPPQPPPPLPGTPAVPTTALPPVSGVRPSPLPWSEIRTLYRLAIPATDPTQTRPLGARLTAAQAAKADAQLRAIGYPLAPATSAARHAADRRAAMANFIARVNYTPTSEGAAAAFLDDVYRVLRGVAPFNAR